MSTMEFDPTTVEWADPPPRATKRDYSAFVDTLRANPGVWAILRRDAETGKVSDLRNVPGVEVTSRPNDTGDGTSTVWARWVGLDEYGQTKLTPEQLARREARKARKEAKAAEVAAAAGDGDSEPF